MYGWMLESIVKYEGNRLLGIYTKKILGIKELKKELEDTKKEHIKFKKVFTIKNTINKKNIVEWIIDTDECLVLSKIKFDTRLTNDYE